VASRTLIGWWRGDFTLSQARGAGLVLEGRRDSIRAFPNWFERYMFADVALASPAPTGQAMRSEADLRDTPEGRCRRNYDRRRSSGSTRRRASRSYWLVDCAAEAVEIHRDPGPEGYRELRRLTGPATLALLAFPDVQVTLAEIFA
jgi:hypothetical protein